MAKKHLGKKGIFLTFIAISIITALMIIFTPSNPNLEIDSQAVETRVSNVNEYVSDLENVYLEKTLHATGRKTLIALIGYIQEPNPPFTDEKDFNDTFSKVFLDGTLLDDTPVATMTDNTYEDRLLEIVDVANYAFNVDTSLTIDEDYGVHVYQENPWFVIVEANVTILVESETAKWDKEITVKTEIGIENFYDPYYLVKTGGVYENKLRRSYTMPDAWDVNEVKAFIGEAGDGNGNYTHFDNEQGGPSFLMRFIDETFWSGNPDYNGIRKCCGIESLVNPNEPSITDEDVSYVDYKYWDTTAPSCPTEDLWEETSISGDYTGFKFYSIDDTAYRISADPTSNVQQVCPPPP